MENIIESYLYEINNSKKNAEINKLFNTIKNIKWFENIGQPINDKNITTVLNINQAKKYWTSNDFEEANSIAWEAFRQIIVKDDILLNIWKKKFNECKKILEVSLTKSSAAKEIMNLVNEDVKKFSSKLPFLGAIGEILTSNISSNYNFYSFQIPFYVKGHWVCGWKGKLYKNKFVYPKKQFLVY